MTDLRVLPTRLAGLVLVEPAAFVDERGFFVQTYSRQRYAEAGIDCEFVQDNHSRSARGSLRGIHFQVAPGQPKLVRCARGRIYDVALDLRRSSPTFGEWEGFELDDAGHRQLYLPIGFGHAFQALTDEVDVVYKVGSYYDTAAEAGIAWDDPDLGIRWPITDPILSARDRRHPRLAQIGDRLPDW